MMMVRVKYGAGRSSGSGFTEIRGTTSAFLIFLSGSRIGFRFSAILPGPAPAGSEGCGGRPVRFITVQESYRSA